MKLVFRILIVLAAVAALGLSTVGCNMSDDAEDNEFTANQTSDCDDGDTEYGCECPDGSTGYQECSDGSFADECICEDASEENLCGGTTELTYGGEPVDELFVTCGPCDDGELVCDGDDDVRCAGASEGEECPDPEENLCGGTSELIYDGEPVDELFVTCGPCDDGELVCDGDDDVRCAGAAPAEDCPEEEENICGGTSELTYGGEVVEELGASCGPCDDGEIDCDGQEALQCVGASPAEACLPTGTVEIEAWHADFEYWAGDREVSVFFLENFTGECQDAIDELADPATLRAIDGYDGFNSSINVVAEEIPIDVDYTVAVVMHAEHSGVPVTTAIGCDDVELTEEDETVTLNDLGVYEVPSELADEYMFRLLPYGEDHIAEKRLDNIAGELEFNTEAIGMTLIGCYSGATSCGELPMGLIPFIQGIWPEVQPFTTSVSNNFDLGQAWLDLANASDDMTGDEEHVWHVFEVALNERWSDMASGSYNNPKTNIGHQQMVSLNTLTAELTGTPEFESDWEENPELVEFALERTALFDIEGLTWTWGTDLDCYGIETPSFDDGNCDTQSLSADEVEWSSPDDFDVRLSSLGWSYTAFDEFSVDWPLFDLVDVIWEHHLEELEGILNILGDDFFFSLFYCPMVEDEMVDIYEDWRDDNVFDYEDYELDALIENQWRPFCEEFQDNGADIVAAAIKSELLNNNTGQTSGSLSIDLEDDAFNDSEDRLFYSLEPDSYPGGLAPWSRPLFDSIEPVSSDCTHWLHTELGTSYDDYFGFCFEPEIEATGW